MIYLVKVKIRIPKKLLLSPKGKQFKTEFLDIAAKQGEELLSKNTPKHSGKGANSYHIISSGDSREIRNDTYYLNPWVNDGTGIYGPRHARIKPVHARYLHFTYRGQEVFAKSVAGQPGKHFVERSVTEIVRSLDSASVIAARRVFG